jgi:hypothetical protein
MFFISNSYFAVYNADADLERFRNLYLKSAPKEIHQRLSSLNFNLSEVGKSSQKNASSPSQVKSGKLRFAPPFHYELRTEEKRQGVRNGKYRVFGKVVRNVVHPSSQIKSSQTD